ncbi:MAG TPA: polynucleotide kinase-phosphatase [Dehalococcoidia bacterium]|nr:polynucleotide kinase-phosphatase [Dehalococcoidia bacterium]
MNLTIPELCLVVLIGASGSGKSTFARKHFKPTELLSSDFFRGLVSDDENDQGATKEAFEALHFVAAKRLAGGRLTVVDATNVQPEARKPLVALARENDVLPVAIVLNLPAQLAQERNVARPERDFGPHVVRQQHQQLQRSLRGLQREGFRYVFTLSSVAEVEAATIERQKLWTDRKNENGPFDIIGDVHGCYAELTALLANLGYELEEEGGSIQVAAPNGRRAIFLGDLVDRGPDTPRVLRLVMSMVRAGTALCVPGNHDVKLMRALQGKNVQRTHGLEESLAQLEAESNEFKQEVIRFIDGLISHYVLDEGRLVVAHAGMKQAYQGRASSRVRDFALFGETTGETDEYGLPVRYNWASEYRGRATVVYGHTPVVEPAWLNRTICLDTGCVFGGRLTALRYPENELVSVPSARVYYEPVRPLSAERDAATVDWRDGDLLDIADVTGKRTVTTRLHGRVTIREENAAAALEVMSRFAADPRWLLYLPPTMSPSETSRLEGYLEHPLEAFDYYRNRGISEVICQEKHMGSRAIVVVCKDVDAAARRFHLEGEDGVVFTRTGRRFFADTGIEKMLLAELRSALKAGEYWGRFQTDWFCFDCEIMPWSLKAQELIDQQYAPAGESARAALPRAVEAIAAAAARGVDMDGLLESMRSRDVLTQGYVSAYEHFAARIDSPAEIRIAPFHLLASEGSAYFDKPHSWHLEMLTGLQSPQLKHTQARTVDLTDEHSVAGAVQWWEEMTAGGSEGMVVKPMAFTLRDARGLVQPALKCRGREYLRLIYGAEYTLPANLDRLRNRGLSAKRSLALREFALGVEALERFVAREPLWRVHECVFGVLALESEPVDPRL